jgi:hypothetical protein
VFFWRPGVPRQHITHLKRKQRWFSGLAAVGGKAKQPLISEPCVFLLALAPQASKKPLGQQTVCKGGLCNDSAAQ